MWMLPPWKAYQTTGLYEVGVQDLEFSTGAAELCPDNHVVGRLFYPAAPGSSMRWFTAPCFWLPHRMYALGYATALFYWSQGTGLKYTLLKQAVRGIIWTMGSLFQISATWAAPLLAPPPCLDTSSGNSTNGSSSSSSSNSNSNSSGGGNGNGNGNSGCRSKSSARPVNGSTCAAECGPADEGADCAAAGATLDAVTTRTGTFPAVLFSHAATGNRNTYSSLCAELASQGFVVFAVEHADGSASAVRLAHTMTSVEGHPDGTPVSGLLGRWRLCGEYDGKLCFSQKSRWRVRELVLALRLLRGMSEGEHVPGLRVSGPTPASELLRGRLDMSRVCVMGHSFGGATAALAASEHTGFKCAVALDPWWGGLPPDCCLLNGAWRTPSPMLVIGSQEWNMPRLDGSLLCDGTSRLGESGGMRTACNSSWRETVLRAAATGGDLLFVIRGITHHSYNDVLLFFGHVLGPIIKRFDFHSAELPAKLGLSIISRAAVHFLRTHLRLSPNKAGKELGAPEPLTQQHVDAYTQIAGQEHVAILRLAASNARSYRICAPAAAC